MTEGCFVLLQDVIDLNGFIKKQTPSFTCNCGCGYQKGKIWVWDSFIFLELTTGRF